MCNIVLAYSKNYLVPDLVDYMLDILPTKGRDNYSALIVDDDFNVSLIHNKDYDTFKTLVDLHMPTKLLLLHSRAIPETETNTYNGPNIYTNNRFYVAHHGIIPNAERINKNIKIDSQALLDIYETIDYENIDNWFMQSVKKYPRSSVEIVYDVENDKLVIANTFMPLYYTIIDDVYIYVTYKVDDRFCGMQPYSVKVIDLKEILVYK
jgi:hypothetical protein